MVSPARTEAAGRTVRPSEKVICSPMIAWIFVRERRPMRRFRK